MIAVGALVAVLLALFLVTGGRSCDSREDVEARVAEASAALQRAAAEGKLQVSALAAGVKRLNAASAAYETDKDAAAFCAALHELGEEFDLSE